jgi:50S ribosomal subunit-associated GTPase HflX
VIDVSNPQWAEQTEAVDRILSDLNLQYTASIRVLNKMDLVGPETLERVKKSLGGTAISAKNSSTLMPLIEKMETMIEKIAVGKPTQS